VSTAASSKKLEATSLAARSMLEEENEFLLRDLKSVEDSYGTDVLTLAVASGYLDRLLKNVEIERYLARHHGDIIPPCRRCCETAGQTPCLPEMTRTSRREALYRADSARSPARRSSASAHLLRATTLSDRQANRP
jgi:hypothetical protein